MGKVTTAYLLTCAAIGVAGGIVLAVGWWLSVALFATVPFASVAIAGLWVMPAVIALRLLQRPFAGLLVGLISGLVLAPFYTASAILTTLFWSFFPELPFLVTLYRRWSRWLYYLGATALAVLYGAWTVTAANMQTFPFWVVALYLVTLLASELAAVALGILIADRLRAAGVARLARRRVVEAAG